MKRYEVLSHGERIGETDLEFHDDGMNVYSGRFYPSAEYSTVRAVFKALSASMDRVGADREAAFAEYARKRDELQLSVRNTEGRVLSSGAIDVLDLDDTVDDLQIEVYPPAGHL